MDINIFDSIFLKAPIHPSIGVKCIDGGVGMQPRRWGCLRAKMSELRTYEVHAGVGFSCRGGGFGTSHRVGTNTERIVGREIMNDDQPCCWACSPSGIRLCSNPGRPARRDLDSMASKRIK